MVRAIYEEEEVKSAIASDDIVEIFYDKAWFKFIQQDENGKDSAKFSQLFNKIEDRWRKEAWKKILSLLGILVTLSPFIRDFLNWAYAHLKIQ